MNTFVAKSPTFVEGALLALATSIAGAVLLFGLELVYPLRVALRFLVPMLAFGYLLYLLWRGPERVGRVTTVAVWLVSAGALWFFTSTLSLYLLGHLFLLWLARSLYHHGGVLPALLDAGLNGFALLGGLWAWLHSGSPALALWTFFLVQAAFVFIPSRRGQRIAATTQSAPDPFEQAHRAAEAAVRRLSTAN